MPKLTFLPLGATVDVPSGTPLLDAARLAGAAIEAECGGKGTCGGCLVSIEGGRVKGDYADFLPAEAVAGGYVLACRAVAGDEDLIVRLGADPGEAMGRFAGGEMRRVLPASELSPLVEIMALEVPEPRPMDGLGDVERLARAVRAAVASPDDAEAKSGQARVHCPLDVLQTLPESLRASGHAPHCAVRRGTGSIDIVSLTPQRPRGLGLAVDIGTTSIAVELIDLTSGTVVAHQAGYNAQVRRGADVISRIEYAARPGGLGELRALVLKTVNDLSRDCLRRVHGEPEDVLAASLSGNTTMTHLALGIDPRHIRLDPYTPAALDPEEASAPTAREVSLDIHPEAPVLFAPAVGSYLGGDILSGLLITPLAGQAEHDPGVRLFIDIGTNGEAVLGGPDFLLGCACSAGPAFEGGGLTHGMRAQDGAIEAVAIDPATGEPELSVIGGGPAMGLCGSGAIDAIAGLKRAGLLDASGRLDRHGGQGTHPRIEPEGRKARYVLARSGEIGEFGGGLEISLSEPDIDNLIRAKAAIYSGCQVLLDQAGLGFTDLAEVIVAGGFGRSLHLEQSIAIGLLPDIPRDRFRFIGNASLAGSALALLSEKHRRLRSDLAARLTYLDLSLDPGFMDAYTAALFLPHTDRARFPSAE